jgi:hypothetical protein
MSRGDLVSSMFSSSFACEDQPFACAGRSLMKERNRRGSLFSCEVVSLPLPHAFTGTKQTRMMRLDVGSSFSRAPTALCAPGE